MAAVGRRAILVGKAARPPTLVSIYLRGGMDGLNVVPPWADRAYYDLRPTIAVPRPDALNANAALDLDGYFGFHPRLAPIKPLYDGGELAVVHAVGPPLPQYSHFTAQDNSERGATRSEAGDGGWLARCIDAVSPDSLLRGVSIGVALDLAMAGTSGVAAIADSSAFQLRTSSGEAWLSSVGAMHSGDEALPRAARHTVELLDLIARTRPGETSIDPAAHYPATVFGKTLTQAAQYIKSGLGLTAISINMGGWDHHNDEPSALPPMLDDLAKGLAAFRTDLGSHFADVVVVTVSEFGRCAAENGSRGTDHGYGSAMFVLGGGVAGGRVYGDWPGLVDSALIGGNLAVTTDVRSVLGEVVSARLGADPGRVFPGVAASRLGLIR